MFADSFRLVSIHCITWGLGASILYKCPASRGSSLRQHGFLVLVWKQWILFSSVLWQRWLGDRKGIQPAENPLQLFLQDHDEVVVTQEKPSSRWPKAASLMHTDGSIVFARWCQSAPQYSTPNRHLHCTSAAPAKSLLTILTNGHVMGRPLFTLKTAPSPAGIWTSI